jgi:lipoprotein-anchoring transpeptidase ErfK/SrfK
MSHLFTAVRTKMFFLLLALVLILVIIGLASCTAASLSVPGFNTQITPLPLSPFAFVKIEKPIVKQTEVVAASLLPTSMPPTEVPTEAALPTHLAPQSQTAETLAFAQIVADTPPAVGYSLTTQYDAPPTYSGNKYILVDISEQHMYVYQGEALIYSFVSSTGMNNATRTGTFSVLEKIPSAYGETWDIWMPNWLGIYWAGNMQNGIHALPILPNGGILWAGYLGTPISYGCVVLDTYDAQTLYEWADIGTPVEIRW